MNVALGIVLWSLKAICLVVTQAKHCILLCVSMTKSLHISHILSALLQDIPSIALCMSGTLSSSSEVSICGQTESVETRHSQNERKFVSCKNVTGKTGSHALLIPSLPAEHCCAEDGRTPEPIFCQKREWERTLIFSWKTALKYSIESTSASDWNFDRTSPNKMNSSTRRRLVS